MLAQATVLSGTNTMRLPSPAATSSQESAVIALTSRARPMHPR